MKDCAACLVGEKNASAKINHVIPEVTDHEKSSDKRARLLTKVLFSPYSRNTASKKKDKRI